MRVWARLAAIVAVLGATGTARADAGDKPLAEALFQDGRVLLDQDRVAEACTKFAASQKIEPKIGTLLNLAVCHEREGRVATAWAEFVEAESVAERTNQTDRVTFAKEHAAALEHQLSRVVITTSSAAALMLDGLVLDASVIGTALPLDPGAHTLTVSAPRKRSWTTSFVVPAGPAEQRVEAPPLADEPLATSPGPEHAAPSPARAITSYALLGIGMAGLGLGTYFGVRAFSKRSDAERECTGSACSARGLELWRDVGRSADLSTASFAIGAVAVAVGTYLLFSAPRAEPAAP